MSGRVIDLNPKVIREFLFCPMVDYPRRFQCAAYGSGYITCKPNVVIAFKPYALSMYYSCLDLDGRSQGACLEGSSDNQSFRNLESLRLDFGYPDNSVWSLMCWKVGESLKVRLEAMAEKENRSLQMNGFLSRNSGKVV